MAKLYMCDGCGKQVKEEEIRNSFTETREADGKKFILRVMVVGIRPVPKLPETGLLSCSALFPIEDKAVDLCEDCFIKVRRQQELPSDK